MSGGFEVDRASLVRMAQAINATVSALNNLAPIGFAANGQGFPPPLGEAQIGHPVMQAALGDYDRRGGWWVQDLVQTAQGIAQRLGASSFLYGNNENYVKGVISQLGQDLTGNPLQE